MSAVINQTSSFSPQYAELVSDLFTEVLGKMLNPEIIRQVCGEEITLSQLQALRYLYRHGGECSVTELGEGLAVTTPATTKLVDRLEKRGWVARREDDKDHRVFHVGLSESGKVIVLKVKELRSNRMSQIIESMSPESRQALLQGLETFVHAALTNENMLETICQHCGTESIDGCIINRTHAEMVQQEKDPSKVCD